LAKKYLVSSGGEFSCSHPGNAALPIAGSAAELCAFCSYKKDCEVRSARRPAKRLLRLQAAP